MKPALIISSFLLANAFGVEFTVKSAPLERCLEVPATFIASEPIVFRLEPKQWKQFTIAEVVDHGTLLKKDDTIISFEAEDYKRHLAEKKEDAKSRKIALAKAERELADLKITTQYSLEGLKIDYDRAKESLDYFTETGRALEELIARESLERSKRSLSYQEEELKQLLKMYEEDGITEETEEIILKRQRASVKTAQLSLKRATQSSKWALEKTIPRQGIDLKRTHDSALLALETGKAILPGTLQDKVLSVAKLKRAHAKADQDLLELINDGKLMNIKAPVDGMIYYGEVRDNSWSIGGTAKFLFKAGSTPANKAFASLIPTGSSLTLHGSIGQADLLQLPNDATGTAKVEGIDNASFPVTLTSVASAPNPSGQFDLNMNITLPEDSPIVTGMKAKVNLVTYRKEAAIAIPRSAISTKDGTSSVKLKMADGKHEIREIKTGQVAKDKIEILEGLEVDQVIIVPDSP